MTRARTAAVISVLSLLVVAAGCGGSSDKDSTATTKGGGVTVTTAAPGTVVTITVSDTKGVDGPMTMDVSPATAPAGNVTFKVKNSGTIEHEVVVLKTDVAFDQLPVVDGGDPPVSVATGADKVDEGASVGETGDPNLKAGDTRSFTVTDMKAGKYVLVCNIAKHYGMGMRAAFTVS